MKQFVLEHPAELLFSLFTVIPFTLINSIVCAVLAYQEHKMELLNEVKEVAEKTRRWLRFRELPAGKLLGLLFYAIPHGIVIGLAVTVNMYSERYPLFTMITFLMVCTQFILLFEFAHFYCKAVK